MRIPLPKVIVPTVLAASVLVGVGGADAFAASPNKQKPVAPVEDGSPCYENGVQVVCLRLDDGTSLTVKLPGLNAAH